ncbi:Basal_body protein [Hexamita inflata]|uniref:Basal body protein n=1 Tax=Hexamita inflata TaxID=28002 RepID=A0AA86P6G2_9EUKA|nr:Basal body protein [Hexamita inflata]
MSAKVTFATNYPDKQILFDQEPGYLKFTVGEKAQYTTRNVVDMLQSKVYTAQASQGTLTITNLRVIYVLDSNPMQNISVGYAGVQKILVGNIDQTQKSSIVQQDRTLVLVCSCKSQKYRFEFLPRGSRQVFDIIQTMYRAYDTSRAYRVTKTRQVMQNYLLPQEFIEKSLKDVQMISPLSPTPLAGTLQLTTYRVLWFCDTLNVLVPYLDIDSLTEHVLNNVPCVILQVTPPDGSTQNFTVAFHAFTLQNSDLFNLLVENVKQAVKSPQFGVNVEEKTEENEELFSTKEIKPPQKIRMFGNVDRALNYVQGDQSAKIEGIEFDEDLGVAFERVEGVDRADLV